MDAIESKSRTRGPLRRIFKAGGPGLITGAADDDPSGIATYSQAGAQFGYALTWTVCLTLPFMALGACGVVSVASNVAPREVSQMIQAMADGQLKKALRLNEKLGPLFKDLFIETNPIPVKAALAMMGIIEEEYRLPLVPLSPAHREKLRDTMKQGGYLK